MFEKPPMPLPDDSENENPLGDGELAKLEKLGSAIDEGETVSVGGVDDEDMLAGAPDKIVLDGVQPADEDFKKAA